MNIFVFASSAFEKQPDFNFIFVPLLKVHNRTSVAEVVAAILSGQRIDRIGRNIIAATSHGKA